MRDLIEKAFLRNYKRYFRILTEYYPSHNDIGFTERNLSCNFVTALEYELGKGCFSWFEAPIDLENKKHIDAIVFDIANKVSFLIEAKRFTSKSVLKKAHEDIKRMNNKNHIDLLEAGLYSTNIEKRYAILLGDIWTETTTKKDILTTWPDYVLDHEVCFSMHKGFAELQTDESWKYDYNLLIVAQEISI